MYGIRDVESGARTILPVNSQWPFIRKVYSIITFQLLLNIAVASVVVFVHPIANFFATTTQGLVLYIVLIFVPFLTLCSVHCCHSHPLISRFLALIFNITLAFPIGLTCAFIGGKVILESLILSTAVVFCLTLYTFWAKGHNYSSLGPFLFGVLLDLMLFTLIQIVYPLDKLSHMIYGCLGAIIFCGYIVFDTHNLIKMFSIDDYIVGSIFMYLDIINLFVYLLENLFDLLCICRYANCNCRGCGDCFYCGDCGGCCGDCGGCGDCGDCGDCVY